MNEPFYKDPLAKRYIDFKFPKLLGTDTIASQSVIVPTGLTLASPAPSILAGNQTVRAWFSGGTLGAVYPVTCRIVTAAGRELDLTIDVCIARKYREIAKDPDSLVDISVDWSLWLDGQTSLATSSWSSDAGISVSGAGITGDVTTGLLDGGTLANWYEVLNSITAADGQQDVYAFMVFIQQQ